MEVDFDKEIDSLLRQTAQRETAVSPKFSAHVDADEISLFAENALPVKARTRITEHLADCSYCRNILANLIALNVDEISETIHAEEPSTVVNVLPAIPWYRKLFAFPSLAYTMGGLVVLLAGLIGFVTLQNFRETENSSVAMEKSAAAPSVASGANSNAASVYSANTASNSAVATNSSNSVMSNGAGSEPLAYATPAPSTASNANTSAVKKPAAREENAPVAAAPPVETKQAQAKDEKAKESEQTKSDEPPVDAAPRRAAPTQNEFSQNADAQNQRNMTPDTRNAKSRATQELPLNGRILAAPQTMSAIRAPEVARDADDKAAGQSAPAAASKTAAAKKETASSSNKTVGGKNFTRKNSVWYDTSYRQQKPTNVARNSEEYKKFDAGLRSIADSLGGTVVIVWRGKAYRIQ